GHAVIAIDRDAYKVETVLAGRAPFYEPGLDELVKEAVTAGRLSATTSVAEAVANADVAFLCVGTPSERNGNLSLEQIGRVAAEIAPHLAGRVRKLIVACRSTVFPGTCEGVILPALGGNDHAVVVSNPEFLREGTAIKDFFEPSLVVVGGDEPSRRQVAE